ncbi:50S ribosomal protein L24 [Gemmatimonadota bacterium]
MHVRKNDQVVVIAGNDRGKTGKILKTFPESNRIVVEGINFIKRHTRGTQTNPQGGIVEREGSIHSSNVMVVCARCGEGVRTRSGELTGSDGKTRHVRTCTRCGEMVGGDE